MAKVIKIGLIGYGTVGCGVDKILMENAKQIEQRIGAEIEIAAICDLKHIDKKGVLITKNYKEILDNPEIDIVVELIGGYEPARTIILEAFKKGKSVVSANKAVLAKYWGEVLTVARNYKKLIYFEAAVGGGIPVIQALNEGLAANKISKISGILNGTTNYILSEMTKNNLSFAAALKNAQKAGFAESDPSFDVKGVDTAHKLVVLASLPWASWLKLENITTTGIENISQEDVSFLKNEFGFVIKLLGTAQMHNGKASLSVEPRLVSKSHPFANVEQEYNAILFTGDAVGDVMFYGKGAGQMAAASAVVSDIIFLSREVANETAGKIPYATYNSKNKIKLLAKGQDEGSYYLRFTCVDKTGVLSSISGVLGKCGVSIAEVYQKEPLGSRGKKGVSVIIITHKAKVGNIEKAVSKIDALGVIKEKTEKLRIEE